MEYSLSEKGKLFLTVLKQLSNWTVSEHPEINFMACKIVPDVNGQGVRG